MHLPGKIPITAALGAWVLFCPNVLANASPISTKAPQFFQNHCTSCHGEKKQKGDVTLHDIEFNFSSVEGSHRWMAVLDQLETGEMPPEDEDQPSPADRETLIASIKMELQLAGNPVEILRSSPKYGNYVNHTDLFSGEHRGPSFSRPRIWRISPYIDGKSSPFGLSQEEGFKDYAHMWSMDKPTIELLLMNAKAVVEKQIGPSVDDLKVQDGIWKEQILGKRRNLQKELKTLEEARAKSPKNSGLAKKSETLNKQLERNLGIDFEKDRNPPPPTNSLAYGKMSSGGSDTATGFRLKRTSTRPSRANSKPLSDAPHPTKTFPKWHPGSRRAFLPTEMKPGCNSP